MDQDRVKRKMMATVAKTQRGAGRRAVKAVLVSERADEDFCPDCLAVRVGGECPRCHRHAEVYDHFCRHCLRVHSTTKTDCAAWQPRND